jgi:hypothetical protein
MENAELNSIFSAPERLRMQNALLAIPKRYPGGRRNNAKANVATVVCTRSATVKFCIQRDSMSNVPEANHRRTAGSHKWKYKKCQVPQVRAAEFAAITWEVAPSTSARFLIRQLFLPQLGCRLQPTADKRYIAGLLVFWPGFMLACFLACAIYIRTLSACS